MDKSICAKEMIKFKKESILKRAKLQLISFVAESSILYFHEVLKKLK